MNDIVVEYSGWIRLSPQNIRFEYIGQDDMPQNIDGVEQYFEDHGIDSSIWIFNSEPEVEEAR